MDGRGAPHDPKITHLYEVVGSHFVDLVYNSIYSVADKAWKDRKYQSVTDAYLESLKALITQMKTDPDSYAQIIQGLYAYARDLPGAHVNARSYTAFIDRIAGTLFPGEMFESTRDNDRDEVVSSAMCDLVAGLGAFATAPHMINSVVDSTARNTSVVHVLQNHAVATLFETRTTIHNKFLGEVTQAKGTASLDHVNRLTTAIRKLATEKAALEDQAAEANEGAKIAREKYRDQRRKFRGVIQSCEQRMAAVAARCEDLEAENRGMRAALERRTGSAPPLSAQLFAADRPNIAPEAPAPHHQDAPMISDILDSSAAQDAMDTEDLIDIMGS
jgi:hypothetical protein